METEQARHETEESLILAQFGTSRNISHKLQNGGQSSERDSLQITANTNWNHYKSVAGANSMKRQRENCNSPAAVQELFDQGSYMMNGELMNGELKHALTEQSLLAHQSKKLKVDSEMKGNDDMSSSLVDSFPELTKATEFECNTQQTEIKLDKRNCNFPNGDIFCLPRNKQVSIPNGAVSSPSTIESTPGDLLEKTLSQYYPEQVSIAPQTSGPQLDAVNGSLANKLPSEGAQPRSLNSGLPSSAQMPDSQQQQPGALGNVEGGNNYNSVSYAVNGYSNNFEADHQQQQQQQQHQQQPPSYSGQELPLGQLPVMIPPTNTASGSQQHQNGPRCYPDDTNPQGIFANANQEFNQNSFLERSAPLQAAEAGGYGNFSNSGIQQMGQSEEPRSGQHQRHGTDRGQQYGMQTQKFKQNAGNSHETDSTGPMGPSLQQPRHAGLENGMDNTSQQRANISCSTPQQRGWVELNSSHSQQQQASGPSSQAQEQDMWRGFPAKPQSEQQTANPQVHCQMLEPNPAQRFQTQGGFTDSSQGSNSFQRQQQDCLPAQTHCAPAQHNTAPEWQQSNSKAPQMQQTLPQKMPEQRNFRQDQQAESRYHTQMQSEHLCEDPDLQDILSPGFLPTQQQQQQQHCLQRPLSHPPQFEGQQLKSPDYRPRSQPQPGQQQLQPNQPLRNTSAQSNNQHIQHSNHATFSYSNTTDMQQQHQRQFPPNSGSSNLKQFQPQRPNNHCHQPNHADFSQTSTQSQPQLPQGALNQQVSTQMYPKAEQQLKTSCTQFQRGPRLPLAPVGPQGDFQRHAALRMHLLQRQERQGPPHPLQSTSDPKQGMRVVRMENGLRFESPGPQQQEQQLQMREAGMGGVQVKQENQPSLCEQSKSQGSILASMEQSLRQYQLSPVFEKKSLVVNSSKVKVESSGPVTVLSTNTDLSGVEPSAAVPATVALKKPDLTPKKEHLLQSFMDSPMKLLDTPIKNLLDTPMKTQYEIASCHCVEQISEKDEGPYYTHLGAAPSVAAIRETMEKRSGLTGHAIRIEKVIYTGKEGKSTQGCPIAKWVIRRSSVEEKLLVLVRERTGHKCDTACIIVVILVWEGIQPSLADRLYLELRETLTKHGALTQRRCAINEERTCACQGLNPDACGASFSFGCSWSMYYNGCKFARSKVPRKFKLLGDDMKEEEKLEHSFQNLATLLGPLYKTLAPEAYGNQVEHEHRAPDCRLGLKEGRPFSGVTACLDFCAHAHRDLHNMQGGSTVVCTLTSEDNREIGKIPDDEQLHVLPLYKASSTDEFGSEEGQQEKIKAGAIQVLSAFRRQVRMLAEPAKSCRQKKLDAKKAAANKNAMLDNEKAEKALQAKSKAGTYENTAQSAPMAGPIPGAMGATLQSGQPTHPLGVHQQQLQQQQHQRILPPYPGSTNVASYPRFPNHPGSFPSTSKPSSMYPPQPPTPASPYPNPLHVPNSYINGSNRPYPGYQCNGGMPLDNYHPYYASNPKHLDMYRQQRPALYSEQQYGVHQRYEVNYPPRYGEPGLQVNGYNACSMRPVHPMRPYTPYGPNGASDPQFMDPLSRAPSAHGGLDYTAAVSKGNQFGGYPNPYLSRSPQILPPGQDPFHMQIKTEMGMPHPQMLSSQLSGGCLNPETQSGSGPPNGSLMGSGIKQEPGLPQTPTTPQKPEVWSDNEHNFLDPDIGGVAVAPSHGSVLIECAKRELHATTPVKNPNRNHPTRISLVFYQHKNMNEAKHGLALWEAKMAEKAREKEEDAERNGGEGTPSKGKKGVKREHQDSSENTGEPPYKRFIQALMEGSLSCTTNTYVSTSPYAFTKVTGPYSQFV
ncbi:methylcytosine dioxygenase TET2 [Plectropomus leopardus]|uniref:methylcytosine dioxygenase TET2 n=1 Tax=Plectropomus leopardus TaxID=160734 RepID=UPI001C4C8E57|nr:methylcytosine dioxygenase TET2 [Plectropomus leopardus]